MGKSIPPKPPAPPPPPKGGDPYRFEYPFQALRGAVRAVLDTHTQPATKEARDHAMGWLKQVYQEYEHV